MAKSTLESWSCLVNDLPRAAAAFHPDGSAISRAEIDERSEQLCVAWRQEGLSPQRLIALNLPNGFDWMVSYLAALKFGAIVVPLDPIREDDEVVALIKDLGVQALWNGRELRKSENCEIRRFHNKELVVCKLTSGSTGKPKPLFFCDKEMLADGRNIIRAMAIRPDDTNLGLIPWGHSYGLGSLVYPLLIQGTRVTWTDTPFPSDIADTCQRTKATVFPSVPTVLRVLIRSGCDRRKLRSLRLVVSAGARLSPEVAQGFKDAFGISPKNFYGSTETGGIAFDATGEAALTGRSVGKPIQGVRIIPSRGRRFYIEGEAVYHFGNRYVQAGGNARYLAADYGYLDPNGELVLDKRAKGIIKIGGRRINPAEVECLLEKLSLVKQAVVFSVEAEQDTLLAAALETTASRVQLLRAIRDSLPKRLRPKKIAAFDVFPTNRRGKVDLSEVKKAFNYFSV